MIKNSVWFRNICQRNQQDISDDQMKLFEMYVELLSARNLSINLVSNRSIENIWIQHILASISFLFNFQFKEGSYILDIGTGGGLPGIPLALLNPSSQFVLIDSIKKKINTVKNILEELKLKNVSIDCGRVEELSIVNKYKDKFDYTISRALASIFETSTWSKPLLKNASNETEFITAESNRKKIPRGTILLLKGGKLTEEICETQIKIKPKFIKNFPLIIDGVDATELFDKKLIIIKP